MTHLGAMGARALVGILVGLSLVSGGVAVMAAQTSTGVDRLAGADRYATSAAVSRTQYPDGADVAFVASGVAFPDATAAAAAAAAMGGPVLLSDPHSLSGAVRTELGRLHARTLYVLGGTAAIDADVLASLRAYAPRVERLAGADRFSTAVDVAQEAFPGTAPVVFLASGESFPDALSGAAAAGHLGGPLLLSRAGSLPAEVATALGRLRPSRLIVLGGRSAISDDTLKAAQAASKSSVERWGGADRAATAVLVSQKVFGPGAATAFVASGATFPDALSGGAAAGAVGAPLLLADRDRVSLPVQLEMRRLGIGHVVLVGGVDALSGAVADSVEAAMRPIAGDGDGTFAMVTYPDTQQEVFAGRGSAFIDRSRWIVANRAALDVRFVMHTGDVVNWDSPNHPQYVIARTAFAPLDTARIPYALSIGNHDTQATGVGGSARDPSNTYALQRDTSVFNSYWKPADYIDLTSAFEPGKVDNTYSEFRAEGADWLVLNLELWPRLAVVSWAQNVIETHPQSNVVIQTHSFLDENGMIDGAGRSVTKWGYGDASPQYMYDRLVAPYANLKVVTSGHTGVAASRVITTAKGNHVAFMLQTMHSNTDNPVRLSEFDVTAGSITTWVYAPSDGAVVDANVLSGLRFVRN